MKWKGLTKRTARQGQGFLPEKQTVEGELVRPPSGMERVLTSLV